ncbi:MAG: hypothetical protein IKX79_03435, partial [Desulfovibrionaceae bacterium]|nr:hypothetical protein [Desulfovibrionaceae bacterium]
MPQPAESEKLESLPLPEKGPQAPSPAEEAVSQTEGLPPIESEGASSPAEAAGALPVPPKASEEPPADPTPDDASQTEIRPGIASRLFRFLACCGPVAVLLFLAIELVPGIEMRGLLTGEEKTLLSVVQNFPGTTGLFVYANGAPEPSLYPLHIWFLKESTALLHGLLPALSPETLLHAASAIGLALMGIALWLLAFFTAGGLLPAFASCAVFLGTLHIVQATHLATVNGLFAALLFLSLLFLCIGWSRTRAPLALLAGHVLAVLAFLSGGVCGLGIPLLASLLFLFWRGAFRRAGGLDGVFAFGVLLVLSIGWLFWLSMDNSQAPAIKAFYDYHESMWYQNFLCRPEQIEPFAWRSLLYALPWLLVVLCLPWERLHHVPVMIWKNRTQNPSLGWVWCSLLATLTALTLCWPSTEVMLLPLAGLASILAARAVLHLSIRRSRLFFTLVGILMALVSLPLLLAPVMPTIQQMLPERAKAAISFCFTNVLQLPGMFIMGAILLLFAVFLVAMTNKRFPTGGLLICLLFTAAMAQPFNLLTLPDLTARGILLPSCPLIVPAKPADTPKAPRVLKQPAQPAAQNPAQPPAASPETPISAPDAQAPEVNQPQGQSSNAPASTEGS